MENLLTLEMLTLVNGLAIQHSSEWEDYVEMNAQIHGLTKEEYTAYYLGTQWQMQCMESLQILAEKKVTRKQLDKALNDVAQITNDLKKVVKEWSAARDAGKTEKQEEKLQELKKLNDDKAAAQKVVDDHIQQLDKNATLQTEDEIKIEIDGDYDIEVEKDDEDEEDNEETTESMNEKKSEFKEGDRVKLTLKGLQQMNRDRTPGISNNYSRSLGKIRDKDITGTVERVFPSGSMNVYFDGVLYDIKDYMVVKESVDEKIKVASLEDAIDAEQDGDLNKRHLDKILKRKASNTIHQMTGAEEKTYHALLRKYKINEGLSDDAYSLHRLASNVGTGTTEEFLSNHNLDIKLVANAIRQGVINKYELRDIILGKAPKSKIKSFMKEYVSESIDIDMVNTAYGFWGTMSASHDEEQIEIAITDAITILTNRYNFTEEGAYNFLNSKWGRKLADEYLDGQYRNMVDAIEAFTRPSTYKKYAKEYNETKKYNMKNVKTLESFVNEAAPKLKTSKEEAGLLKLRDEIRTARKGGSASRYSKEFDAAKKKALKAVEDMITYASIGV